MIAAVTLALQPQAFGEGAQAVAKMAQPTAEPVDDYEYVMLLLLLRLFRPLRPLRTTPTMRPMNKRRLC